MTNTISAGTNPALANNLVNQAMEQPPMPQHQVQVLPPSDTVVILPGGYINAAGEVITEAEVRELNGNDEEAIARSTTLGKALLTILNRGTVRIGNEKATDQILDNMLSGDRDMLILGILKATFGTDAEIAVYCDGCKEFKTVTIDLNTDIKVTVLPDPVNDRVFTVQGRKNVFTVQLPTGVTQKEMINNAEKTTAELNTVMLENCVLKIDNSPVLSKLQVQNLGLTDRKNLIDEINSRLCGPQFDSISVTCPDCESEVSVPVHLGTLFRL